MGKNNIIIIGILVLFIIGGVIYYFSTKDKTNKSTASSFSGGDAGVIMGSSSSGNSEPVMSNQNQYMAEVLDIRGPINKAIEELISQSKYSTLFEKDEMIGKADKIKSDISSGIERLKKLNLSTDLKTLNDNNIKSLGLLNEAMDAYIAMQNSDDQTEKQKQSELFSYKIEESNKTIESQTSSGSSGSSGNSNTNSSLNVSDVLQ